MLALVYKFIPIPTLIFILAGITLAGSAVGYAYWTGRTDGKNSVIVKEQSNSLEKLKNAKAAQDRVDQCFRDPACSLRNDGYRRD